MRCSAVQCDGARDHGVKASPLARMEFDGKGGGHRHLNMNKNQCINVWVGHRDYDELACFGPEQSGTCERGPTIRVNFRPKHLFMSFWVFFSQINIINF